MNARRGVPWRKIATTSAAICVLYILLYQANVLIVGSAAFGGITALVFLPAFTRLLGFLLLRFWTVPPLFIAAWFCVDLGLDPGSQFVVALALAVGAPIAIDQMCRAIRLEPSLGNLSGQKLLALSAASALGSGLTYHLALLSVGVELALNRTLIATIVGDAVGTWAIIYILKFSLMAAGRLLPASRRKFG